MSQKASGTFDATSINKLDNKLEKLKSANGNQI